MTQKHHKELELEAMLELNPILQNVSISSGEYHVVEKPQHYNTGGIECIDAIEAALTPEQFIGYLRGSVLKYQWRCMYKGKPVEDVEKSIWYANKLKQKLGETNG